MKMVSFVSGHSCDSRPPDGSVALRRLGPRGALRAFGRNDEDFDDFDSDDDEDYEETDWSQELDKLWADHNIPDMTSEPRAPFRAFLDEIIGQDDRCAWRRCIYPDTAS